LAWGVFAVEVVQLLFPIPGMVQKRPILGNTDNSNPTRILRVSID
jgi:hypothetical protein